MYLFRGRPISGGFTMFLPFLFVGGLQSRTAATYTRDVPLLTARITNPTLAPARQAGMSTSAVETGSPVRSAVL